MKQQTNNSSCVLTVISGDSFPTTGYWGYDGHVWETNCKAIVVPQSKKMLFIEHEKVPTLGSCPHTVRWKFIKGYKQSGDSVE